MRNITKNILKKTIFKKLKVFTNMAAKLELKILILGIIKTLYLKYLLKLVKVKQLIQLTLKLNRSFEKTLILLIKSLEKMKSMQVNS